MLRFIFTLIVTVIITQYSFGFSMVKVSLFNQFKVKTVIISPLEGKYQFSTETGAVYKLKKNNIVYFTTVGDSISVWDQDNHIGVFHTIYFRGLSRNNVFKIESAYPALPFRQYEGDLEISSKKHKLIIVNYVALENYLAGVVEAESGPNATIEFYKSQAIISRTYLFDRITREGIDDYFIGDDVNYQVYKGMCRLNPIIRTAVVHSSGLVIIDTAMQLITATFHSNSGGNTANSEDVWLSETSYLKSSPDPFSLDQRNTIWYDTIPVNEWIGYLKKNGLVLDNEEAINDNLNYSQKERQKYYCYGNDSIALRKIRSDFKLRSTWFSFSKHNNTIILVGRGYGHGVGLSQEGAMEMARQGFSFSDIIHFYYKNISVVPYSLILKE